MVLQDLVVGLVQQVKEAGWHDSDAICQTRNREKEQIRKREGGLSSEHLELDASGNSGRELLIDSFSLELHKRV